MLKLFAVVLGGKAKGANTELHDVVFAVGRSLEDTYPKLVNKWFGQKKGLHIDSTTELKYVDGYEVVISKEKSHQNNKLFFVNFGGYKSNFLGELHEIGFYVAGSKPEVLARAKQKLCLSLIEPHCDDNIVIDDIIPIDQADQYHIHLRPTQVPAQLNIVSDYRRLDLPDIMQAATSLSCDLNNDQKNP